MPCCDLMATWAAPGPNQLIYTTGRATMSGICLPARPTWVSIRFCPWCGSRVSDVEDKLIGREMAEL